MTTVIESVGFMLALLGAASIESECMWIPIAMMAVGVLAMGFGVHMERR